MTAPGVSVVVPAYNCGPYLGAALESVLGQTLPPAGVIVVDDGSTDDTPAVAARFGDRVRYVRQDNAGVSAARNRGLDLATGEFVALLDADDVCRPDRLALQAAALAARPDAVGCLTGHWLFRDDGTREDAPPPGAAGPDGPLDLLAAVRVLTHTIPLPMTLMFRRAAAPELRFPLGVRIGEDVLFCSLLRTRGEFVVLPDPLYGYRTRPGSASRTHTPIDSFEQRLAWVLANRERYCPGRSEGDVRRELWEGLADVAGSQYWGRQREMFLALRHYLRTRWPADLPAPAVARWRWYPDWVWSAKGWIDRRFGRAAR